MKKILFLLLLVLTSCRMTKFTEIIDPHYNGNFHSNRMIILSEGTSLSIKTKIEQKLRQSFDIYDIDILYELEITPPTKNYSQEDIYRIALEKGADSILIIAVNDIGTSESYFPINNYAEGTTSWHRSEYKWMKSATYLHHAQSKEIIWMAEGSGGTSLYELEDLATDIAKQLPEKLFNAGLIRKRQK